MSEAPSESLDAEKLRHLQQMGRATLDEWLWRVFGENPTADTPEKLCALLSEELDSPFEDCQPSAPLLALIEDWMKSR